MNVVILIIGSIASRNQEDKGLPSVFTDKTFLEQRQEILVFLREKLEPHLHVYALWLEGADARGTVDEFSDLDVWLDVEDGQEEIVLKQLEKYLNLCGSHSPRLCLEKIRINANEPLAKFARFLLIPRGSASGRSLFRLAFLVRQHSHHHQA